MLKKVLLVCAARDNAQLQEEVREEIRREEEEAVGAIRAYGLETGLLGEEYVHVLPALTAEETLCLVDSGAAAQKLKRNGAAVAGWSHTGNRGESFRGIGYVLEEPGQVDLDSYVKIWQRERGLPWTILETERCVVREFVPEDMEAICALYDGEARRWLEAPSDNLPKERAILKAYIKRVYGLFGYGHWAVIMKETGGLIGRMGYAVPRHDDSLYKGVLGYLVGAPWRRQGLTEEVCRALIRYGLDNLCFSGIIAEVNRDNKASCRLLQKLGFEELPVPPNRRGESTYALLSFEEGE